MASTAGASTPQAFNSSSNRSAPVFVDEFLAGAATSSAWPPLLGALARISPSAAATAAGTSCAQRGSDTE